jgi:hypothetical protein
MTSSLRFSLVLLLATFACSKTDSLNEKSHLLDLPGEPVELALESAASIELGLEEATVLKVRVTWAADGSPADDRPVVFDLAGAGEGAELSKDYVRTSADGRAQVTLTSGTVRTTFSVVISTPQAKGAGPDPRQVITVSVDGVYRGKLQVKYSYAGPIAIKQIVTRIHDSGVSCPTIAWPTQPLGVATQTATAPTATLLYEGLPEGQVYTVTASALGIAGQQVAVGCLTAPAIVPRAMVTATVPLVLRPTTAVGVYDFGAEFHFDEALPGRVGEVVSELENFFLDPADVLGEQLVAGVSDVVGIDPDDATAGLTTAWVLYALFQDPPLPIDEDGDGDMVDDAVRYFVLDKMPGWVGDSINIGGDLTGMLTDFHTGGTLEITSANVASGITTGAIVGRWDFQDFLFRWRAGEGCDFADTCCGRHEYTGEQMGLSPFGGEFIGALSPLHTSPRIEYTLNVPNHQIELQYGNMALFLLEAVVLPAITGEQSMDCAVESLFGCDGASDNFVCGGASLNGDICGCERAGLWLADTLGITPDLGEAACAYGIQGASGYLEDKLLSLTYDGSESSYLTMSLNGTWVDGDKNNTLDDLATSSVGTLTVGGDTSAFTGVVRGDAQRQGCVADAGCEAYEACVPKSGLMNECTGRLTCVQGFGDKLAAQACTTNAQCWSNVCHATRHKCVEVCSEDVDCGGTLGCGDTPVSISLSTDVSMAVHACGM